MELKKYLLCAVVILEIAAVEIAHDKTNPLDVNQRDKVDDQNTYVAASPLKIEENRIIKNICGVTEPKCGCEHELYRRYDGTCNNIEFGSRGSRGSPLSRVRAPLRYADGIGNMQTSETLPLARVISTTIFKDKNKPDSLNARSVMEWGQLLSHDTSFVSSRRNSQGGSFTCCGKDGKMLPSSELAPECIPIEIPDDDPFYSTFNRSCMHLVRSKILNQEGCPETEPIQQVSSVTHFVDASFVYGNSKAENERLRTGKGGQLKTKKVRGIPGRKSQTFLPNVETPTRSCDVSSDKEPCYMAGDARVNLIPFISALQTIFVREHNRIASGLQDCNPNWLDNTLFEEARRIVIAQWQHITYEYWLPRIIGKKLIQKLKLDVFDGTGPGYSNSIDPSTMNEFTTGAYRFFHSTVPGDINLVDEGRCPFQRLRVRDHFDKPGILEINNNFDSIFRGSTVQPNQKADEYFTKEITNYLLKGSNPFGDDLESIDLQRQRDHGIPTYNEMRQQCGLSKAKDFEDFMDVMTNENINKLKMMYRTVDDVDFFVGGTLETLGIDGDDTATAGPTFGCVIAEQFYRWKFGDRYFFDVTDQPGSFSLDQLNAIIGANFSSILCENLDSLKFIQEDVFLQVNLGNELKHCKYIPRLDLTPWKGYQPKDKCAAK